MAHNSKNNYPVFKDKLCAIVLQRRLRGTEIAKHCGISKSCISHYLNGIAKPSISISSKLCLLLDVSIEYLLTDWVPLSSNPPSYGKVVEVPLEDAESTSRSINTKALSSIQIATLDAFLSKLKNNEFSDRSCIEMLSQWVA